MGLTMGNGGLLILVGRLSPVMMWIGWRLTISMLVDRLSPVMSTCWGLTILTLAGRLSPVMMMVWQLTILMLGGQTLNILRWLSQGGVA